MAKAVPFRPELLKMLKDPVEAAGYLNAALEEDDEKFFLEALRDVTDAQGGIGKLAEVTSMSRTSLYKTLSGNVRPKISTLRFIMEALGSKFTVTPKRFIVKRAARAAKAKKSVTRGRPRDSVKAARTA